MTNLLKLTIFLLKIPKILDISAKLCYSIKLGSLLLSMFFDRFLCWNTGFLIEMVRKKVGGIKNGKWQWKQS